MTLWLFKLLASYLLGSVSGSLVVGRLKHVDIRTMGSGNAGGTNAFRTQGLKFALAAVVIDVGKSMLAAGPVAGAFEATPPAWLPLACGFAAVLGHCYPIFHGFRGGKGAATAVGALAVTAPALLVPMLATWLLVLVLTGYVGLATVLAGLSLVPAAWWMAASESVLWFCSALALFMIFTHRSNILRLFSGTENRFDRVRVTRWFGARNPE